MKKISLSLRYVFFSLIVVFVVSPAFSETYTWTDKNGEIHITDDLSKVPDEFRKITPSGSVDNDSTGDLPKIAHDTQDVKVPGPERDAHNSPAIIQHQEAMKTVEKVTGIEIIDYGLFTTKDLGTLPNTGTTTGQLTVGNLNTLTLARKTNKIPAVLGNKFGIRYRLKGATPGEEVLITVKVQTPGLKKIIVDGPRRSEQEPTYEEKWNSHKRISKITYDGFIFEKDWELVPGKWIIQIFYGDKWMGEKIFEVYQAKKSTDPRIPAAIRKEIDRLSSDDCAKRLSAVHQLEDMGRKAAPAGPALIRTMRYYSLPTQRAFDCGSGKAAAGALGKIGQPAVKPLIQALSDSELMIREGAKDALAKIGKPASKALINAFQHETDMYRRLGAADVLGLIKEKQAVLPLITALEQDPLPPVRGKAAEVLGILNDKRAVKPLTAVVQNTNENWHVRSDALDALLKIEGKEAVQKVLSSLAGETDPTFKSIIAEMTGQVDDSHTPEQLAAGLNAKDSSVRISSLQGLARKKDAASRDVLIAALQNPDWDVRSSAADILGEARERRALEPLIQLLKDKDWNVRTAAAAALGKLKDVRAVGPLMEMYKTEASEKKPDIRPSAIQALGQIGDKRATNLIMTAVNDQNMYVRRAATTALGDLKDERSIGLLIDIMKEKIPGADYEAKISLGQMGEPAIMPLLQSLRGEREHGNRLRAMDALTAIGTPSVEPLIRALKDRNPYIMESAARVLGRLKDSRAVMPLIETLRGSRDERKGVQKSAAGIAAAYSDKGPNLEGRHAPKPQVSGFEIAQSLGMIGAPSVKPLTDEMRDSDPQYKMYIVKALGETRNVLAMPPLVQALGDNDPRVRSNAAEGLGNIKDAQVTVQLIRALKDKDPYVRRNAAGALGKIKDKRAVEPLLRSLKTDPESRWYTIESLGQIKDKRATKHIIPFLKNTNQQLRLKAAGALAALEDKKALLALIVALNDKDRDVKWEAANALRKISKKDFGDNPAEWRQWLKRNQKRS